MGYNPNNIVMITEVSCSHIKIFSWHYALVKNG